MALLGIAFGLAVLSCGRDVTSPNAVAKYARGISWHADFPPAYQAAGSGASGVVDFNRVHVVLHHADGTIALDTVIDFPAGADEITVSLDVKLLPDAPTSGEPLSLNLGYINAAGDTVFKGGPVGVTATPAVPGQPPPPPVSIPVSYTGPGAGASAVQISPRSGTVLAGGSFDFTAIAVDKNGVAVPNTPIIWNSLDPGIASMASAASGTAIAGSSRGTARIVAQLLTGPTDQVTLSVLPRATTIALSSGSGQSGLVGATLTNPLVALVTAADGIGVGGVTVNFAVATGGGSVGSASAVTDDAGLAQTAWKLGSTVGAQSVTATSGSLSGSPVTFTATARSPVATKFAVTLQPGNAVAGATISPVTVVAQTSTGDTATAFTGPVTLAITGGTSGAVLGGTATINAVAGVANFADLKITKSGTAYALIASSVGLTNATTNTFNIAAGAATKLSFTVQPNTNAAGLTLGNLAVTASDQFDNTATTFTGLVTIALAQNPGGSTLGGTATATAVAGVASFGSLTLNRVGTGYQLSASATGLTSGLSGAFNVVPGGAAVLAATAGMSQTANVGTALSPISVQVQDLAGNGVPGTTVTFAVTVGGGSLSSMSGVSDGSGVVATVWTLGATVGTQTITATATGLVNSPVVINATATSTLLPHFTFATSPAVGQTSMVAITPNVVVQARDATNALVAGFTGPVALAIGSNPGGGVLTGTLSVNAVGGIATFVAPFSIDKAGVGYTLVASSAGYANGTSSAFNIVAGAAANIAKSAGDAQTAAGNTLLPTPLGVLVTDASGNPVSGRTINWAVAGGGGSVASPTSVTNAAGVATIGWTTGPVGAQSVTATSAGLAGSPLTFTATVTGGVATTTVAPKLTTADTLTSLGQTLAMTATARDAGNNVVAGTYVWVSRTPAFATVSATGVVTAVANGSTWIVATETGGTKDSALVTVLQGIATINVTTATTNIHLGQPATFTAQAVDGLGHPLGSQPVFTWSSTAVGVARINAGTGVAATVGLGASQIRATAGTFIGVSNINVITAIQHIYVARDSATFPTTANDVFSMASLAVHRSYKAYAYDTLNVLMPGVTFTWASSNASVAAIDSSGPSTARAISVANGANISISATAQGVSGSATLTVAQVLTSITISPVSPSIQISGSVPLAATGKDANNQPIIGTVFTWSSQTPAIATVNAATGVVLGVSLGTDSVTATSGAIHGTGAVIVANMVPAALSFGSPTVSVGRGSNTQVPILLSRPSATTTTLLLSVADTFAFWSSTRVVVPANQTAINAQLNGHNAGNSTITVTDSAGVYTPYTSTLAVQATMSLTNGSYGLNGTDHQNTQVLLSDPSPAGGTYITFNYGTAGIASVSPSPAFIPTGQLAANIVITAVAAGTTTITPVAIGVNGTSSTFTTYAPNLAFSNTSERLGAGQYDPNVSYVYTPTNSVTGVPLTFTSSDTNIVTVTPTGSIPAGSYYFYITNTAKAVGTATITVSSPGWTSTNSMTVRVTTPHVGVCCGANLQTTSPQQNLNVYSEDSTLNSHYRTSSLVVHVASTDTTVMKVLDTLVTITPGSYYFNPVRVIPNGAGGTAYIRVTAGGHTSDSTFYNVAGPKLEFSWTGNRLVGVGQEDDNSVYVYAPNNVLTPLVVNLSADTTKVGIPPSVTIPAGTYYAYFNVRGKALGTALPIIASAVGYQGDTSGYTVTTPHVRLSGGGTLNAFSAPQNFTVYSADSTTAIHNRTTPLVITLTSTDTTVLKVDSATVTIPAGTYYANQMHVLAVGTGTAKILATAAGHTPDSAAYTVQTPQLNVNFGTFTIGRLQDMTPSLGLYVYVPDNRTSSLLVTVTQKHASVDSLSATVDTIPNGTYYKYFNLFGKTNGLDTLTFSAPGYLPTTAYIRVNTPKFATSGLTSNITTTNPPMAINVYAEDSVGTTHYTSDTVVVHAVSSDTTVLKPAQAYFPILKGNYYAQTQVNVIGPGTASITYSDSAGLGYVPVTTNSVTVTGPSLTINQTSFMLGMRQNTGTGFVYVYTPNNVATPLVVSLVSSAPSVAIPTVTTVTIPAGSYYAYFQVNALDTIGTIQITATATGYNGTHTNVQVSAPHFAVSTNTTVNTTSPQQTLTIYAEDQNNTQHYTNEDVSVTLLSTAPGIATIDSSTVTIVANHYYTQAAHWSPVSAGSTQLQMSDQRAAYYQYGGANVNVSVITPSLSFNNFNQIGIGQYSDNYFYVSAPDYQTGPTTVTLTHPGTVRTTIPASVIIPNGSYYQYFRITGLLAGIDTIVASATSPAHNPATGFITVGNGRIDPLSGWPGSSVHVGDSVLVTLYARDPGQGVRNVAAATTFTLAPNANITFVSGGATITTAIIPADAQYVQFYLKAVTAGTGSATISATNYTSYVNTMTVIP